MAKRRIFSYVFPAQLATILCSIALVSLLCAKIVKDSYLNLAEDKLKSLAVGVAPLISPNWRNIGGCAKLAAKLAKIGVTANARITVIRDDGVVVFESTRPARTMENHSNRPEIRTALRGAPGQSVRFSATLGKETMYYAIPIKSANGDISLVLRTSTTLRSLETGLTRYYASLALVAVVVAAMAIAAAYLISREITSPLKEIESTAAKVARGEFKAKPMEFDILEIDALAASITRMSGTLARRITQITERKDELNLILQCLDEGVVAVDNNGNVIMINHAVIKILGIRLPDKLSLEDVVAAHTAFDTLVNIPELRAFAAEVADGRTGGRGRIDIQDNQAKILEVHGAPLMTRHGKTIGVLIVIADITNVAKLENMRREFAANVSHELKTPLTAIRGAAETLADGALDDKKNAGRFLEIILKHCERLTELINDTLSLAKVERAAEKHFIVKQPVSLNELLRNTAEICRGKAQDNGVEILISVAENAIIYGDKMMIEQALVNLLDNAVKYGAAGGVVNVSATKTDDGAVEITVTDKGPGILPEHIPRLFERFYRVDKGRGRQDGGTGLGLAIVKHIVQAHDGEVFVESVPGLSTAFTIRLAGPPEQS